jgi:4-hydroxy-tetrahydrodipicolinate synthase
MTLYRGLLMSLRGTFTAMVTPFKQDALDEEGLISNIHHQLRAGVSGLVFLGTTGEASTLTEQEKQRVIEIGVRETKGKATVIIGTGSNSTLQAIENTKRAQALGADMALVVTPYYNKPTQEGIYRHYQAITESTDLPLIVYNIQGRTGVNIETPTLLRIAALPNVIGVKEASNNLNQVTDVLHTILKQYPQFSVLSGDDAATLPFMALGATGVISVVSNLVPEWVTALVNAALSQDFERARILHKELLPLFRNAFLETNPAPIKEAMNLWGLAAGPCRLPLCEMQPENRKKLRDLLQNYTTSSATLVSSLNFALFQGSSSKSPCQ